jgi:hypothetical protein
MLGRQSKAAQIRRFHTCRERVIIAEQDDEIPFLSEAECR